LRQEDEGKGSKGAIGEKKRAHGDDGGGRQTTK
jgi:hypothetical protein